MTKNIPEHFHQDSHLMLLSSQEMLETTINKTRNNIKPPESLRPNTGLLAPCLRPDIPGLWSRAGQGQGDSTTDRWSLCFLPTETGDPLHCN